MRIIAEKDYGQYGVWVTVDDNGFIYKRRKKPDVDFWEPESQQKDLKVGKKESLQKDLEVGKPESPQKPNSCEEHLEEEKPESSLQHLEEDQRCRDQAVLKMKIALLQEQKRKYISEIQSWQKILNRGESEIGPFATDDPEIDEGDELDTDVILELQVQVEFLEDRVKRLEKEAETADQMRVELEEKVKNKNSVHIKRLIDEVTLLKNSPRSLISGLTSTRATPLAKGASFSTEFGRLWVPTPRTGQPSRLSPEVGLLPRLTPQINRLRGLSLLSPQVH